MGNTAIMQDKAYFEVRLQQTGINKHKESSYIISDIIYALICFPKGVWGIGLGSEKADLNSIPMGNDVDSWVLCSDGYLRHNKEEMHRITQLPQEGDTIV